MSCTFSADLVGKSDSTVVGIDNPALDTSDTDPTVIGAGEDNSNSCDVNSVEVHDTTKQETLPEVTTAQVTDAGHDNQAFTHTEEIT